MGTTSLDQFSKNPTSATPRREKPSLLPKFLMGLVVLGMILTGLFYSRQLNERQNLMEQRRELEGRLELLKQKNKKLSHRLKHWEDRDYVEELARKQLGMLQEGEKVFKDAARP